MAVGEWWTLTLWGPPTLRSPTGDPMRCEGKPLGVLVYLALQGPTSRARLADVFWPDSGRAGRNNLVNLIRRMERTYGARLCHGDHTLTLHGVQVIDHAATGDRIAPDQPLQGLQYPDLPEFSAWMAEQRDRLLDREVARLLRIAEERTAVHDFPGAVGVFQRALALRPLSEDTVRRTMRALYLSGDLSSARQTYEHYCRLLDETLQATPMPLTRELASLIARAGSAAGQPHPGRAPAQVSRPGPFVGRKAELTAIQTAWRTGQVVMVTGEAGLGKSRLAQEALAGNDRTHVFQGRPGDGPVPYASLTRSLRTLLAQGDLPDLQGPAGQLLGTLLPELLPHAALPAATEDVRDALHRTLREVYRRVAATHAAFLFDDLHLMDAASLEAVAFLLSTGGALGEGAAPPRVMVCFRPKDVPAKALAPMAALVHTGRALQLDLAPLTAAESQALLQALALPDLDAHRERLTQFAGGNPLYLLETVNHFLTHGPAPHTPTFSPSRRATELIVGRVERLSTVAVHVARAASVLQRDFSPDLIAEMLRLPVLDTAEAWADLEHEQVIAGEQFTHEVVREAMLHSVPPTALPLLHRSAARALAAHGASPARVAPHWLQGERLSEAADAFLDAGNDAKHKGFYRDAAQVFGQAAAVLDQLGEPERAFQALARRAQLLYTLEDQPGAWHASVQDVLARAQSPAQQAQAWLFQAQVHFSRNELAEQEHAAQWGLTQARAAGDHHLEAEFLELLASCAVQRQDMARALAVLSELETVAAQWNNRPLQARAAEWQGFVLSLSRPADALVLLGRAETLQLEAGPRAYAASAASKQSRAAFKLGQFEVALQHAERARGYLGTTEGFRVAMLINTYTESLSLWATGKAPEARKVVDAALGDHHVSGSGWLTALNLVQVRMLLAAGQVDAARHLGVRVMSSEQLPSTLSGECLLMKAALEQASGEPDSALATLQAARQVAASTTDLYLDFRIRLAEGALRHDTGLLQCVEAESAEAGLGGLCGAARQLLGQPLAGLRPDPLV